MFNSIKNTVMTNTSSPIDFQIYLILVILLFDLVKNLVKH